MTVHARSTPPTTTTFDPARSMATSQCAPTRAPCRPRAGIRPHQPRWFAALLLWFTLIAASAGAVDYPHGSLVPTFGDNGIVRLYFEDRPGANGVDDVGKSIRIVNRTTAPFGPHYLLVAGLAGRRVQITKLTLNGALTDDFGAPIPGDLFGRRTGVTFSTRTNVASFAGLVVMPNGDIVIGYADDYIGPNTDTKDFFIEVFDATGLPKNIGGDEMPNQRWVDLSTGFEVLPGFGPCSDNYRQATARSLLLTAAGSIVVLGEQVYTNANGNETDRIIATAEFGGADYVPFTTPGSGFNCYSVGGNPKFAWDDLIGGRRPISHGWAGIGDFHRNVLVAGMLNGADGNLTGSLQFIDLANRFNEFGHQLDRSMPAGFWRARNSIFKQIRSDAPARYKLFGYGESGVFGGQSRLQPIIADARASTMDPSWFLGLDALSIDVTDGHVLDGNRLLAVGSAHLCDAVSGCNGPPNRLVIGVSNGQRLLNTWLPETGFRPNGWVQHNIPDYSGLPTTHSMSAEAAVTRSLVVTDPTDLYVVGWFRSPQFGNIDTYVAKVRVRNGLAVWVPVDPLFRDGFEN